MRCAVCEAAEAAPYRSVDGIDYFRCDDCGSLFADPAFLASVEAGGQTAYADEYWRNELKAARERCFGPAIMRVAETIAYCRIPIGAFIDIGAGTGWLLDALAVLLPEAIDRFHAVELYPPPLPHRTANPNYVLGTLGRYAADLRCRRLHRGDRAPHAGYAARPGGAACRGVAAWIALSVQLRPAGLRGA